MYFKVGDTVNTSHGTGKIIEYDGYFDYLVDVDGSRYYLSDNDISSSNSPDVKSKLPQGSTSKTYNIKISPTMSLQDAYNTIKRELETNPEYFELWEQQIKNLRLKTNTSCEMLEKMFDIKKPQNTLKKRTLKDYHE